MSRLTEITQNHVQLNELFSLLEHYGVSAEFVSYALIKQFERNSEDSESTPADESSENNESKQKSQDSEDSDDSKDSEASNEDMQYIAELLEDLKQFHARF